VRALHAVTLSEGFAQPVDAQGPINGPKEEREGKDWRFCNAQTPRVLLHDLPPGHSAEKRPLQTAMPQEVRLMIRSNAAYMHCRWHGCLPNTGPRPCQRRKLNSERQRGLCSDTQQHISCIADPVVSGINQPQPSPRGCCASEMGRCARFCRQPSGFL
jgi:hypothetical protein